MYYAAQDIIEYLMNSVGGGAEDSELRMLRSAAHNSYRDVVFARDWNWHVTEAALPAAVAGSNNKIFTLPANVKNVDALVSPNRLQSVSMVTPSEYRRMEAYAQSSGGSIYWTIMKSPLQPDRWQLMIAGNPSAVVDGQSYYMTYRRKPAPLRYMGYEAASRDNSLTGTTAPGCVKRYGTVANFPEGPSGIHPFVAEEILGLSGSLIGTPITGCKTAVSDFLDVSENLYTALLSSAEVWVARMMGKNVEGAMTLHQRDLRLAMEADVMAPFSGRRDGVTRYPEMTSPPISSPSGSPNSMGYYGVAGPDTGV